MKKCPKCSKVDESDSVRFCESCGTELFFMNRFEATNVIDSILTLYFSGTGNTKYIAEFFSKNMDAKCHSIEDDANFAEDIKAHGIIAFCYPVYMSRVPRIMREFVSQHMKLLEGKKIIILCTQLALSGDGTRAFAVLFPKNHVEVIYTEHFFMPNNVSNMAILPMASDKSMKMYALRSQRKMHIVCENIKAGKIRKRGFSLFSRFLGLFQGVFMGTMEKRANKTVKVANNCTQCGVCVAVCPMGNLVPDSTSITHKQNCTMCYRCINKCPQRAITVFIRKKPKKQYTGIRG